MVTSVNKPKIVFVDDESMVLSGIRRSLRPYRKAWDMTFCEGGRAALVHLEENPSDIIISDMRMPEMDGAALLETVQQKYPGMIRIVLSGYSEQEQIVKTVNVAHQYLAKPCQPESIKNVIDKTMTLAQMLNGEEVKAIVGKIESLPTPPQLYQKVVQAIKSDECTAEELATIIEEDPAMMGKLLKLVNSSFFGLGQPVNNCADAIARLGYETVHGLILHAHIFSTFPAEYREYFNIEAWQQACLKKAKLAKQITWEKQADENLANDSFIGALLQDIGELLFAMHDGQRYQALRLKCKEQKCSLHDAEIEEYGVSHAVVGSYLMGVWGLSYALAEAVAYHHTPSLSTLADWSDVTVCHLVGMLADAESFGLSLEECALDFEYLSHYSITKVQIEEYQAFFRSL